MTAISNDSLSNLDHKSLFTISSLVLFFRDDAILDNTLIKVGLISLTRSKSF